MTAFKNHTKNAIYPYSPEAWATFNELDRRVSAIYAEVIEWEGWKTISKPDVPTQEIFALVKEIFRSVAWYQSHTTEAGFHMLGRLPKGEVKLIQALCSHKAEEAEHGEWAKEDLEKLGSTQSHNPPSPATFAVSAVWWRMAQVEDALGYLGAEYLFEQLTALVTQAALPIIEARKLPQDGLRFIIEHAVSSVGKPADATLVLRYGIRNKGTPALWNMSSSHRPGI
jgi:hypothetical protein